MLENLTEQQKKMLVFASTNFILLLLFLIIVMNVIRSTQAMKAYARAMNTFADAIEEGAPVTINVAQFKDGNQD